MIVAIGLLTTVAAVAATPAVGAEISGAGATFPYPIYAKWAEAYKKATGVAVNYQPVGSGEGIRQIQNKEVTFGASDMPLKPADLEAYGLAQFPTVIGGVVSVVNLEGIKPGELTIDGPTLAKIFLGEIKSWNVLSDINMPGMSGLELLPKAKAMRPDVPIIMITAYGDAETKRKALERGAEALLTKPIDFVTLRSEIDMRVGRAA